MHLNLTNFSYFLSKVKLFSGQLCTALVIPERHDNNANKLNFRLTIIFQVELWVYSCSRKIIVLKTNINIAHETQVNTSFFLNIS